MEKFSIKKPYFIAVVGSFILRGYSPDPTRFEPFLNFSVAYHILKSRGWTPYSQEPTS